MNLQDLYVLRSNLNHLTKIDLDGLSNLKIVDFSHNPIKRIYKDFFEGHSTIVNIAFYDCQLQFIEVGALDALTNLEEAHFQLNECIDNHFENPSSLAELKEEIKYCDKQGHENARKAEAAHNDDSFGRRNAYLITFFLITIIFVLIGLLYKAKAFNGLRWW